MLNFNSLNKTGMNKFLLSSTGEITQGAASKKAKRKIYRDPSHDTCEKIMNTLLANEWIERHKLASITGFALSTISNVTRYLLGHGNIQKREVQKGRGRIAYFKLVA